MKIAGIIQHFFFLSVFLFFVHYKAFTWVRWASSWATTYIGQLKTGAASILTQQSSQCLASSFS